MLRLLVRQGVRRGLLGGSRPWLAVGAAAGALALIRRLVEERPETVHRERIAPGDALVLRGLPGRDGRDGRGGRGEQGGQGGTVA